MALILLNPGVEPLGEFDAVPALVSTVKGGEVLAFTTNLVSVPTASDSSDGYLNPGASKVALGLWQAGTTANTMPAMLCDEGILNYGTLFGAVVGGTVGTQANGPLTYTGAVLGPSTALASGRLTAWDKPGLYGLTIDNTDTSLQPTASGLATGAPVYANASGLVSATQVSSARQIGTFVEFRTKGSLVTTPNRLVSALNSPSSVIGGILPSQLFMAVIHFSA
jgi:hypothetical protein